MTEKDYRNLADGLLDERCEMFGIDDTIIYLLDQGYTKEQILELGFEEESINRVLETYDGV